MSTSPTPLIFSFYSSVTQPDLHSFPTRRSSDLTRPAHLDVCALHHAESTERERQVISAWRELGNSILAGAIGDSGPGLDRKSTRLNSSHSQISYAGFCLKKTTLPPTRAFHDEPS